MEMNGFVTLDSIDPEEPEIPLSLDLSSEVKQWSQGLGVTGETVPPESAKPDTDEQLIMGYCNF